MVPSSHGEWPAAPCSVAELRLQPGIGHISVLDSAPGALAWLRQIDAPTVSYMLHFEPAAEVGLPVEDTQGLLVAVAPIVGTARVASAAGKLTNAFGFVIDLAIAEKPNSRPSRARGQSGTRGRARSRK